MKHAIEYRGIKIKRVEGRWTHGAGWIVPPIYYEGYKSDKPRLRDAKAYIDRILDDPQRDQKTVEYEARKRHTAEERSSWEKKKVSKPAPVLTVWLMGTLKTGSGGTSAGNLTC